MPMIKKMEDALDSISYRDRGWLIWGLRDKPLSWFQILSREG